jgi:ABC-type bacteriocin/lantibiotic exporter with double-glycine peptidase domain
MDIINYVITMYRLILIKRNLKEIVIIFLVLFTIPSVCNTNINRDIICSRYRYTINKQGARIDFY